MKFERLVDFLLYFFLILRVRRKVTHLLITPMEKLAALPVAKVINGVLRALPLRSIRASLFVLLLARIQTPCLAPPSKTERGKAREIPYITIDHRTEVGLVATRYLLFYTARVLSDRSQPNP